MNNNLSYAILAMSENYKTDKLYIGSYTIDRLSRTFNVSVARLRACAKSLNVCVVNCSEMV